MEALNTRFYIDEWLIDPRHLRMTGQGRTVPVEPKVMRVLTCLAAQPGHVLDREYLLAQVWGDTIVTDHVLTRSISELRKAFGDDPRHPAVIETIPKTGYRLIAPVRAVPDRAAPDPPRYAPGDSASPPLDEIALATSIPTAPPPMKATRRSRRRTMVLVGVAALMLTFSVWVLALSSPRPPVPSPTLPFTSLPGLELAPTFYGKHLAFTWSGEEGRRSDIYVKLVGDETVLQLTDDALGAYLPTWSPDGRHLAFRRYGRERCGVYLISALGGAERKLLDCQTSPTGLAWSPDGAWLAVAAAEGTNPGHGLVLIAPETQQVRPLTRPDKPYQKDRGAVFSPDGRRLAFVRHTLSEMGDLYVIPVDGQAPAQRLTFDNRHIAGLTWATDGRHLIFSSNRSGNFKLWKIPATGGTPEWLAAIGAYDPGAVAVSSEGDYLAYEEWDYEINVWSLSLTDPASPPQRVVASTRWDYHPQFSPDTANRRLAFASNRSGSFEIWTRHLDGSQPMRLTSFNGAFVGMPRWSPEGRRLAFDARTEDGYAMIWVIDAEGGRPTPLTEGAANDLAPSWSHDGRWIYFASDRSGTWQIWKTPAAGGDPEPVTRAGGYLALASWDGRALYYSKYGAPGLWRCALDGGPETKILDDLAISDWGNWTVGEAGIYFVARTQAGVALHLLDPATGSVRELRSLAGPPLSHEPGLTVSPDGRQLLYARADRIESDIMLVESFR